MLFFSFSVPPLYNQQSFLGGDQTATGSGAAVKSSKQHRDQQCQPLRLATFEFDYKKKRRHDVVSPPQDPKTSGDSNEFGSASASLASNWHNEASMNEQFHLRNVVPSDEIDHINGNRNGIESNGDEQPVSLSADCLQDIRALTSSLHDLMNDISVERESEKCQMSSNSGASSANSIPENLKSSTSNDNGKKSGTNEFSRCISPISSIVHSVDTKNGNSLSDIHSSLSTTPSRDNNRRYDTPKIRANAIDRTVRAKRTNLCKIVGFDRNGSAESSSIERSSARNSPIDRLSHSTEGLTDGSSENNIETSDSFVNIQFAKQSMRRNESSSTRSIESSDSYENASVLHGASTKKITQATSQPQSSRRLQEIADKRKSLTPSNRQIRPPVDYNTSKTTRPSLIPVQNNGQARNFVKPLEISRVQQSDVSVKLREKKNLPSVNSQTKNEARNKRFSCLSSYSPKLSEAKNESLAKLSRSSIQNGRKCSSTDELREEQQRTPTTARTKRFSLYYTPQPSRKIYENEKIAKNSGKNSTSNLAGTSGRPTSWRIAEIAARKGSDDVSVVNERRDSVRNRKSVMETSTATSRSKSSRQSVHIRGNATGTSETNSLNMPSGRTK